MKHKQPDEQYEADNAYIQIFTHTQ